MWLRPTLPLLRPSLPPKAVAVLDDVVTAHSALIAVVDAEAACSIGSVATTAGSQTVATASLACVTHDGMVVTLDVVPAAASMSLPLCDGNRQPVHHIF
jgi:hypothetical protein